MNVFTCDKIFVLNEGQTLPDDLAALTVAAVNAVSDLKIVNVPSFDDVAREPSGDFYTSANTPQQSDNLICATVGIAWFTDHLKRKHVRVIGSGVKVKAWKTGRLWPANMSRQLIVYPGIEVNGAGEFMLKCKCGRHMSCGHPRWNGRNCEICQDREEYVRENDCEVYFPTQKKRVR